MPRLQPFFSLFGLLTALACGGETNESGTSASGGSAGGGAGGVPSAGGSSSGAGGGSNGGATGGGPSSGGSTVVGGDVGSCQFGADCTVTAATCCGVCGAPALGDMIAVNQSSLDAYRQQACDPPQPCPRCAAFPNPNLFADCVDEQCAAFDLATHEATACATDDDCFVRHAECCGCDANPLASDLVALSRDGANLYLGAVCSPLADCAPCDLMLPVGVGAACETGHCALVDSRAP